MEFLRIRSSYQKIDFKNISGEPFIKTSISLQLQGKWFMNIFTVGAESRQGIAPKISPMDAKVDFDDW